MRKTTANSNQRIIMCAEANMKVEGFHATRVVKRDGCAMLEGKISANKLVGRYVAKHTKRSS